MLGWTAGISAAHGYLNVNWGALRNGMRSLDRIETLIARPDLTRAMGLRARRYYENRCSRSRRTRQIVRLIEAAGPAST